MHYDIAKYLKSMGYKPVSALSGSGKYDLIVVEHEGIKYVARISSNSDPFEERYCKDLHMCPNVVIPKFLRVGSKVIAIRKFVDETLRDRINTGKRLNVKTALNIAIDITKALDCIHSKNLVYADLKPENVGIDKDRAFLIDTDSITRPFTKPRFITMNYAPPEYYSWGIVVKESDMYQLGLVLRELAASLEHGHEQIFAKLIEETTLSNPFSRPSAKLVLKKLEDLAKAFGVLS